MAETVINKPVNVTEFMTEVVKLSQQMNDQTAIVGDAAHGMATRLANGAEAIKAHNETIYEILDQQEAALTTLVEYATTTLTNHKLMVAQVKETLADQITELNAMAGINA